MTKLTKVIKLIKFLKKNDSNFYLKHWELKKNKLYYATWNVDYHNGDIDDYKQTLVKEDNEDLGNLLESLEIDYEDYIREEQIGKLVKSGLKKIYETKNI